MAASRRGLGLPAYGKHSLPAEDGLVGLPAEEGLGAASSKKALAASRRKPWAAGKKKPWAAGNTCVRFMITNIPYVCYLLIKLSFF